MGKIENIYDYVNKLEAQNADLLAALKSLLLMAKYYKPLPTPANPEDEDEEMWRIAMTYIQAEKAIAAAEQARKSPLHECDVELPDQYTAGTHNTVTGEITKSSIEYGSDDWLKLQEMKDNTDAEGRE